MTPEQLATVAIVHGTCPGFAGALYACVLDLSEVAVYAAGCAKAGFRIHYFSWMRAPVERLAKLPEVPPEGDEDPPSPDKIHQRALYEVHQFREAC